MLRRPRSKQRWPVGGEELYELLRMDHEPQVIYIRRADQTDRGRILQDKPNILTFQHEADPMLYFWPVEGQFVWLQYDHDALEDERVRLVKALLRDAATWVNVTWHPPKTETNTLGFDYENWGDPLKWYTDRGLEVPEGLSGRPK